MSKWLLAEASRSSLKVPLQVTMASVRPARVCLCMLMSARHWAAEFTSALLGEAGSSVFLLT